MDDAAMHEPSKKVLGPYTGTDLDGSSQHAFNFFNSQARVSTDQAFGVMVRTRVGRALERSGEHTGE